MTNASKALNDAIDSARALLSARRKDLEDLEAHIERLKQSDNPLREGPLEKLTRRGADLALEASSALAHLTELETVAASVQGLVDELAKLKESGADAEAKREAKLRELRLLTMRREQELNNTILERERSLAELRTKSTEERDALASELKTVKAHLEKVESDAMSAIAEKSREHQMQRDAYAAERKAARDAAEKATAEIAELKAASDGVKTVRDELKAARDELKAARDANAELKTAREAAQAELKAARDAMQAERKTVLDAMQAELKTAHDAASAAAAELKAAKAEAKSLKELVELLTESGAAPPPRTSRESTAKFPPAPAAPATTPPASAPAASAPAASATAASASAAADVPHEATLKYTTASLKPATPPAPAHEATLKFAAASVKPPAASDAPPAAAPTTSSWATAVTPAAGTKRSAAEEAVALPGASSLPLPPGLPPPPPMKASEELEIDTAASPDTKVKARPALAGVEFTNSDDKRLAAGIPNDATTIAEIAQRTNFDVALACERIWELVSLGFVEVE